MVTGIPGRAFKTARVCSRFECTYFVVVSTNLIVYHGVLAMAERALPGLSSRITFAAGQDRSEDLKPRYLGPIYGWAVEPKRAAAYRLPHETPFAGLWLCGHWTQPAGGIWSVVASGIQTARLVLDRNVHGGLTPLAL